MNSSTAPSQWVRLRYFASTREAIGQAQERWLTQARTLGELRVELQARGAPWSHALAAEKPLRLALNHALAQSNTPLDAKDGDEAEVAFFPPVTGG